MKQEPITLGQNTPFPLKGMLTLPDDLSVPVPAVVLVHGSGSSNMDEKVGKLTPFKDIAEGLAARCVACIRYDKRSYAHGLKMLRDKNTVITAWEETIEDALLAAALLRADGRIDPKRVFLLGHSMGGMLAPRIECCGGDFAGLILLAGSPRRLEEILLEQTREAIDNMRGLGRWITKKQLAKLEQTFAGLYDLSDEKAKTIKVGGGTTLYYFKDMGHPPVSYWLSKTAKPMLIMQGERDVQVKAAVDYKLYQELLGDRENVTFRLYPGLGHTFVPAIATSVADAKKEFAKERHIGAQVLDDLAGWIRAQF